MSYSPPLTPRSFLRSLFPAFLPASAAVAAMLFAPVAVAQTTPAPPPASPIPAEAGQASDWLYAGSDIPRDTAWQFGILPNGVRYAVRNNGVPPGQVSIRVRMDVGSMFETDAERGFAHLLEHLTFRGSEHIPDGETKRIWQRFGVTFGSDSNAQTTPTQTVYQLDLPSVTPANLDESMKLLAGMVREPRISEAAVTAERGVVLSELRESDGPQKRIADLTTAHLFAGQLLGDRSPIGTVASLGAARAGTVQAFHDRWYRPDRAVVVISGDGSFEMTLQELSTAQMYGLPVKVVILNNGYLGMVRQWQELFWDGRYAGSSFASFQPSFAGIAQAYGIHAATVHDPGELDDALAEAFAVDGPALVDVHVNQMAKVFPMVPSGKGPDAIIVGMPSAGSGA